jgi:hypothetical protein
MSTATMTDEDLLFDLDLRVVPLDPSDTDQVAMSAVHTSYVTETCSRGTCGTCNYGCSYTCRRAAYDQNMCL